MTSTEYAVGRTLRIERSSFRNLDVPYGPAHAVPVGEGTAVCGEVVDELKGPWPPHGVGSAPPCPACQRVLG